MKKLLFAGLSIFLLSCGKSNETIKDKTVERALICFEKPMLSKSDSIYIGVRYFKNYSETDDISLKINGISGKKSAPVIGELSGVNYLFSFPPLNTTGNMNCDLIIDNGQKKFTQSKTLKIVENYQLETIWDKMDINYISNCYPLMTNAKSAHFEPIISNSLGFEFNLGSYYENLDPSMVIMFSKFISGLNGNYYLIYDNLKNIQTLTITNGEYNLDPNFKYQNLINDLTGVFGQPKSVTTDNKGGKITSFETNKLKLLAYERFNGTQVAKTVISLK